MTDSRSCTGGPLIAETVEEHRERLTVMLPIAREALAGAIARGETGERIRLARRFFANIQRLCRERSGAVLEIDREAA